MPLPAGTPDLGALDLLISVAETGSLGKAAQAHRISQPAVSMRLRSLERRLGLILLERSTTGSRLTADGVAVVDWARPVVEAVRGLVAGAAALRSERVGRLRIAASMTVAEYLVPGWLVGLHALLPSVTVALQVGNSARVADLVIDRQAELGFVEGSRAPRGLRSRTVGADELVVVVAPTHRWARRRRPVTVSELAETPLVLREEGSGTREVLERLLSRPHTAPALELASTTAIKAAVAAGEAPAVLSRLAVVAELADRRLVTVPVAGLALRRNIRAIWPSAATLTEPARSLLQIIGRAHGSAG